jgi:arylsulfatase A-like enzyme
MPTLAELSGLRPPPAAQGQSLRPLLAASNGGGVRADAWKPRPVISEKQPMGGTDHPGAGESYAIADGGWKLIQNVARPPGKPEFELFAFLEDPLDQKNVAAEHPDVVTRLAKALDAWRQQARAARLASDSEATKGLSQEQLERLRSLGYVR